MKFEITRENLRQGLAAVGASIPTRTTLPVLSNILVEAGSDGVRLSGTDLDMAVSLRVPAEVEEEDTLTVPATGPGKCAGLPALPARDLLVFGFCSGYLVDSRRSFAVRAEWFMGSLRVGFNVRTG